MESKLNQYQQKMNWALEEITRVSKPRIQRMKTMAPILDSPEIRGRKTSDEEFLKELQELENHFSNREAQ